MNNATPTLGAGISAVTGLNGGAFSFPGTNSAINQLTYPHSAGINPTTAITFSAWVKTSSNALQCVENNGDAASCGNSNHEMIINGTGSVFFEVAITTTCWYQALWSGNVADGNWHYLVGTADGSNVKLYVDGVLKTTTPMSGTLNGANRAISIGLLPNVNWPLNGLLGSAIVSNVAWDNSRQLATFNIEKSGSTTATVGAKSH